MCPGIDVGRGGGNLDRPVVGGPVAQKGEGQVVRSTEAVVDLQSTAERRLHAAGPGRGDVGGEVTAGVCTGIGGGVRVQIGAHGDRGGSGGEAGGGAHG